MEIEDFIASLKDEWDTFCEVLARIMQRKNVSVTELTKRLQLTGQKYSRDAIERWKNCSRRPQMLGVVIDILKVLGVTPSDPMHQELTNAYRKTILNTAIDRFGLDG